MNQLFDNQVFIPVNDQGDEVLNPQVSLAVPIRPWGGKTWEAFEWEQDGETGLLAFVTPDNARLWMDILGYMPPSGIFDTKDNWSLVNWGVGYIEDVFYNQYKTLFVVRPDGTIFRHELPILI